MRSFVSVAAIAFSLAACQSSTGLDASKSSIALDASQQRALTQHESQWDHRAFHSYSFVYDFQNLGWRGTVLITVRNDVVVSAIDLSSRVLAESDATYPTIDGVFAIARGGVSADNMMVDVDYDSQYGFPAQLSLQARLPNPGGGYRATISSFQPLD